MKIKSNCKHSATNDLIDQASEQHTSSKPCTVLGFQEKNDRSTSSE